MFSLTFSYQVDCMVCWLQDGTVIFATSDIGTKGIIVGNPDARGQLVYWKGDAAQFRVNRNLVMVWPILPATQVCYDDALWLYQPLKNSRLVSPALVM